HHTLHTITHQSFPIMRRLSLATAAAVAVVSSVNAQNNMPCFDSNLGTNLSLGNDQVSGAQPLGFTFPGPGGPTNAVFVSSHGFVWMGPNTNPRCCQGFESFFLAAPPSRAPFWEDLDPSFAGGVFFNAVPASGGNPARAVITWSAVPEFGTGQLVTAQLQLSSTG